MRRQLKWWPAAAFLLVTGIILFGAWLWISYQHSKTRAEVDYWLGSEWWDASKSEAENAGRQAQGLRSLGSKAVNILEEDLRYDPLSFRLFRKHQWLRPVLPAWRGLNGPDDVRAEAANHLGLLGTNARPSVPAMLRAASDASPKVREAVALNLGRIGDKSPDVISKLEQMLNDPEVNTRFLAAFSLWNLDQTNQVAIDRVEGMIVSTNLSWPSICLTPMGTNAQVFAPRLASVLKDAPWSYGRIQAVHALWSISGDKKQMLHELDSLSNVLRHPVCTNLDG